MGLLPQHDFPNRAVLGVRYHLGICDPLAGGAWDAARLRPCGATGIVEPGPQHDPTGSGGKRVRSAELTGPESARASVVVTTTTLLTFRLLCRHPLWGLRGGARVTRALL